MGERPVAACGMDHILDQNGLHMLERQHKEHTMATTPLRGAGIDAGACCAAIVRPGDTLVLAMGHRMSMAEADEAARYIKTLCPGINVVFADDCNGLAVYRREDVEAIQDPDPNWRQKVEDNIKQAYGIQRGLFDHDGLAGPLAGAECPADGSEHEVSNG